MSAESAADVASITAALNAAVAAADEFPHDAAESAALEPPVVTAESLAVWAAHGNAVDAADI